MPAILPGVRFSVKERLCKELRRCRVAAVRVRYLIVLNLLNGRSAYVTAEVLGVHNTTVYRVAGRFREYGLWGLWDAIIVILAVGFGIVKLIALPFGGVSTDLAIFYGFLLVAIAIGIAAYFGRRRQKRAQAERAEQIAARSR